MTKTIRCPCGFVIRERNEDALVANAQRHARDVHRMELTREQVLSIIQPD